MELNAPEDASYRSLIIDAALRYEELLASGTITPIDVFAAQAIPDADPRLIADLRAFIEFNLTLGPLNDPEPPPPRSRALGR